MSIDKSGTQPEDVLLSAEEGPADPAHDPAPPPRRPGRPKRLPDADQATAIARKAREIFMLKGYGQTSMEDIVAACRISKRTLYRLFPSKADVFGAVISDHRQSMLALPGDYDACSIDEALERIFRIDIDDASNAERFSLIHFALVESRQFPELHTMLTKHGEERSRLDLSNWLASQARLGRIDCQHPDDTAKALMDMIFGAFARHGHDMTAYPRADERARYFRNCIKLATRGLIPRKKDE